MHLCQAAAGSSRSTCWNGSKPCLSIMSPSCARRLPQRVDSTRSRSTRLSCCRIICIAIWSLPPDDSDFSTRWRLIKNRFARALPRTERLNAVRAARNERGIWQRRFWEHLIRDETDYARHVEYCYINPLKHRLVTRVSDWPYPHFIAMYASDCSRRTGLVMSRQAGILAKEREDLWRITPSANPPYESFNPPCYSRPQPRASRRIPPARRRRDR